MWKDGKAGAEMHSRLESVFGEMAPSQRTVFRVLECLRDVQDDLEDGYRPGRSPPPNSGTNVERARGLMKEDMM